MPAMHLVSTDFPAPLAPANAVTCPAGRSRSTFVSAWTGPKCLSRPRTLSRGSAVTGASSITWAMVSTLCLGAGYVGRRRRGRAAAPSDLADAGCATGARPGGAAEGGLVDEVVLDDGRAHVRNVHP